MRVLVAMSGGVDSSVAAALLIEQGHDVVGATMKLWGGFSDSGCCSVADVEDARWAARHLDIDHHVFNFTDDFDRHVVDPYVAAHRDGSTPNPCIECNRHLKFDRFMRRAEQLGFDAVATGHHARVVTDGSRWQLMRGADRAKDQSYVLHMLNQHQLARTLLPVGEMSKAEVRRRAASLQLATATKPDSQDVCFITATGGRLSFLSDRMSLTPGRVIDGAGRQVGEVAAVELVTVGQRRGLGSLGPEPAYAVAVDTEAATVTVGRADDLLAGEVAVGPWSWVDTPFSGPCQVQVSAHGRPTGARVDGDRVIFDRPQRRVAPGQSVVVYDGERVLGGAPAR